MAMLQVAGILEISDAKFPQIFQISVEQVSYFQFNLIFKSTFQIRWWWIGFKLLSQLIKLPK